jgi:transcriptional regulator with XRE-family HTH domain
MDSNKKIAKAVDEKKAYELLLAEEALILDAQIAIQRVLNERGMTQAELARVLGVTESYVSQMLGDSARNLTLRTIARVMHALNETALLTTRRRVKGVEEPHRPYECEADFGPWGEIVVLEAATYEARRLWSAQDWAANENQFAPAELAQAA